MPSNSKTAKNAEQPAAGGMTLDQLSQAFSTLLGNETSAKSPDVTQGADDNQSGSGTVSDPLAAEPHAPVNTRTVVEAALFVGRPDNSPITSEHLASLLRGVAVEEIDEVIAGLNADYEANGCPYSIVADGLGYRMALRSDFAALRDRFYGRIRSARLSPAAVEVLALVAYHEPLSAEEVSRLRGTPSGHILSSMVRRQLLRLEKAAEKGSKKRYFTTPRFLKLFGLRSLEDLPRSDDLQRQ